MVLNSRFKPAIIRYSHSGTGGLNATHIFTEHYSVPVTPAHLPFTHTFSDVLTPGASAVYAIGCVGWRPEVDNLVNDPGFEDTELPLTPGFITCDEESQ